MSNLERYLREEVNVAVHHDDAALEDLPVGVHFDNVDVVFANEPSRNLELLRGADLDEELAVSE